MTEGKDGARHAVPLEESIPLEVFKAEVRAWARRIGVEPKSITVRPVKRKWAGCSSEGRLTFDTGLDDSPSSCYNLYEPPRVEPSPHLLQIPDGFNKGVERPAFSPPRSKKIIRKEVHSWATC